MQYTKHIIAAIAIVTLCGSSYLLYGLNKKVNAHSNAIQEISVVVVQSGLVVPDKDGKPTVNTLLLEAWKQANQSSI